jgi:hypothetical protein
MIDNTSLSGHNEPDVNNRRVKPITQASGKKGGRPRKYAEPSQPITITLPETTLRQLEQIDPDRGRAIVKLAQNASWDTSHERPVVEIVEFAGNTGLVVVGRSDALSKVPFLQLVEVAPGRYLLALDPGYDFNQLEIALNDLLEDVEGQSQADHDLISRLISHFKNFRKSESMSTAQILLLRLAPGR